MRGLVMLLCVTPAIAAAQQPVQPAAPLPALPDSVSVKVESLPLYARPTPAQARYMDGLKTAGRGIAQLKEGVSRVDMAGRDSVRLRKAGYILSGFCGTSRGFMVSGRGRMVATAYDDSIQIKARKLAQQVDTLIKLAPTCEANAAKQPAATKAQLLAALLAYEMVLRDFRAAIGLPNRALAPPPQP